MSVVNCRFLKLRKYKMVCCWNALCQALFYQPVFFFLSKIFLSVVNNFFSVSLNQHNLSLDKRFKLKALRAFPYSSTFIYSWQWTALYKLKSMPLTLPYIEVFISISLVTPLYFLLENCKANFDPIRLTQPAYNYIGKIAYRLSPINYACHNLS